MKNIFRKILAILIASAICMVFCIDFDVDAENRISENLYPSCGVITEVNYLENLVTFEDFVGHIWVFSETEDWMVGDIISVIMDDMETDNICDDEIVKVRYCGYVQ